ncbi:DUF3866 family protein [soil metagenome]
MASFATGGVTEVLDAHPELVRVVVDIGTGIVEAHGYPHMLGPVAVGDRVVVNTTGLELDLGTGGVGFLLWNLDGSGPPGPGPGHVVKLRYSPWQTNVLAAEEPASPHHAALREACSIEGLPVVACGLHSQLPGVVAGIRAALPGARIGYLMSDGGALPLAWSALVRRLEEESLLDLTCTYGHAFGGDLEAVNVFSGLVALRVAGEVDAAVVSLGPGVAGTATALGFSGIEQGQVLDAAGALGGCPVASLRVSFHDERVRHHGVSHHTLTALTVAATRRCTVALPVLPREQRSVVEQQLRSRGIAERHDVREADGAPGVDLLRARGIVPTSMGTSMDEAPEPWLAAAAAGAVVAEVLEKSP